MEREMLKANKPRLKLGPVPAWIRAVLLVGFYVSKTQPAFCQTTPSPHAGSGPLSLSLSLSSGPTRAQTRGQREAGKYHFTASLTHC